MDYSLLCAIEKIPKSRETTLKNSMVKFVGY